MFFDSVSATHKRNLTSLQSRARRLAWKVSIVVLGNVRLLKFVGKIRHIQYLLKRAPNCSTWIWWNLYLKATKTCYIQCYRRRPNNTHYGNRTQNKNKKEQPKNNTELLLGTFNLPTHMTVFIWPTKTNCLQCVCVLIQSLQCEFMVCMGDLGFLWKHICNH